MLLRQIDFGAAGLRTGDYGEVRFESSRIVDIVWRGAALDSLVISHDHGCGARVVTPSGAAFGSSTCTVPLDLLRSVKQQARGLNVTTTLAPIDSASGEYDHPISDPVEKIDFDEKVDLLGAYHSAALNSHTAVTGALVYYREAVTELEVITTEGASNWQRRRDLTLQITVYADGGATRTAGSVSVGSGGEFSVARELHPSVQAAAATAVDLVAAPTIESGDYDLVCDGPLAGVLAHETIGHLAEADHQIGDPQLLRTLESGCRLTNSPLTIVDHAGSPGARGYVPIDDEGTCSRDVRLIDNGVVAAPRLHDRSTATLFGEQPTGNARAVNFRHPPLPRLRTIAVAPGTMSEEELVSEVPNGVLACGVLGGQTDRLGYTFIPAECRVIRNGKVGGLVRGVVLSGNVLDAFSGIDGIGRNQWRGDTSAGCGKRGQYPLPVSAWAPPLRMRGQHVRVG